MTNSESLTNSFEKGLILDENELTQSNVSLSSCLNGTTITYNGNEFLLLNDMGNGKVHTAKLPSGYVPLGVKEYGGIIYVASYNPLTNKSLLGSFPSPQRNFTEEHMGSNLKINKDFFGANIDFETTGLSNFFNKAEISTDEFEYLRPGDKFILGYNTAIDDENLKNIITGFNSPKNEEKILTLKLAVLDKEGNLIDITDQLDSQSYFLKKYEEPKKPEGELITDSDYLNSLRSLTIDDLDNDKFNIYNGKLTGKLYLTALLNTINDIKVQIINSDKENLDTYFIDFLVTINSDNEDILKYYKGLKLSYKEDTAKNYTVNYIEGHNNKEIKFKITGIENNAIINYSIEPYMQFGYLPGLSKLGVYNLSLIGSGEIKLSEWRYYNDKKKNKLILNWGIETYLKPNQYIKNINFNFYEFINDHFSNNAKEYKITNSTKYQTGSYEEVLTNILKLDKLYFVIINIKDSLGKEIKYYRFLYTSSITDDWYLSNVNDFLNKQLTLNIDTILNSKEEEIVLKNSPQDPLYILKGNQTSETYPFKYITSSTKLKTILLNPSYEFSQKDFPLPLNLTILNTSYEIKDQKCDILNKNIITEGNIDINLNIQNNSSDKTVNYYNYTQQDNIIKLELNTISEFKGSGLVEDINFVGKGFVPYYDFDSSSTIFGYDTKDIKLPKIVFTAGYSYWGINCDLRKKNWRLVGFIGDYGYNIYNVDTIPIKKSLDVIKNTSYSNKDLEFRNWNDHLMYEIDNSWKNVFGSESPIIFFWVGGCPKYDYKHDWPLSSKLFPVWRKNQYIFNEEGNDPIDTYTGTNDYTFILWKDINNKYLVLNTYTTKTYHTLDEIRKALLNIYVCKKYNYKGLFTKVNNYAYTSNYSMKYTANLHCKANLKSDENINNLIPNIKQLIINSNILSNEEEINKINFNNTIIEKITYNPVLKLLECFNKNTSIEDISSKYINATISKEDNKLIYNGNYLDTDGNGKNFLENKMYFIYKKKLVDNTLILAFSVEDFNPNDIIINSLDLGLDKNILSNLQKYFILSNDSKGNPNIYLKEGSESISSNLVVRFLGGHLLNVPNSIHAKQYDYGGLNIAELNGGSLVSSKFFNESESNKNIKKILEENRRLNSSDIK